MEEGLASGCENTSTHFCGDLITWINITLHLVITFQSLKAPYCGYNFIYSLFFLNFDAAGFFFFHRMTYILGLSVETLGHSFRVGEGVVNKWLASLKQSWEPWTSQPAGRLPSLLGFLCNHPNKSAGTAVWTRCASWGGVRSRGSWESLESSVYHFTVHNTASRLH